MAKPTSFNDPVDCQLRIVDNSVSSTFEESNIKAAARSLYEKYDVSSGLWLLDKPILNSINSWANGEDISSVPHFISLIEDRIRKFGIQCFSGAGYKNPLMWAHYASNHAGFCIEYEYKPMTLAGGNNGNFAMYPVVYTSTLPSFSLMEVLLSPKEAAQRLLATKAESWAYEKEQRLVYYPSTPASGSGQSVQLPDGLRITKLISGLNAGNIDVDLERASQAIGADFYKMKQLCPSYDLDISLASVGSKEQL